VVTPYASAMKVYTIGHGTRSVEELVTTLREAGVESLLDVRRFPGSRRHPQFGRAALERTLPAARVDYHHVEELGGRRSAEPGEERFACVRVAAFRSYAARMGTAAWQQALAHSLDRPAPCFMCAETLWSRCHRRLIAELLTARGHEVVHLIRPGHSEPHAPWIDAGAEYRDGRLHLCGQEVA
jgi:uncharacterized protein (DUF488 family)